MASTEPSARDATASMPSLTGRSAKVSAMRSRPTGIRPASSSGRAGPSALAIRLPSGKRANDSTSGPPSRSTAPIASTCQSRKPVRAPAASRSMRAVHNEARSLTAVSRSPSTSSPERPPKRRSVLVSSKAAASSSWPMRRPACRLGDVTIDLAITWIGADAIGSGDAQANIASSAAPIDNHRQKACTDPGPFAPLRRRPLYR